MFYMLVLMVASSIICMDASMVYTHILLKLKAALKPMKLARCMRI